VKVFKCDGPECDRQTTVIAKPWFSLGVGTDHGTFEAHFCSPSHLLAYLDRYERHGGQLYGAWDYGAVLSGEQ
jgi:hypothetical protein